MKKSLDSIHLNSKTQDSNTLNSVHGLSKSQPTWLKQSNSLLKSNNSSKSNENIQENRNHNFKNNMNSLTSTTSNTIKLPTLDYITKIIKPQTISLQSLQNLSISSFSHQTLSLFNNNPHTQKSQQTKEKFLRDESLIKTLYQQVKHMKIFIEKQIRQKVIQMHKLFTEGNKKSIQLIMLIIKELQRQNSRLRMELQMTKTQLVRSQLQNRAKDKYNEEQIPHKQNHFKQTKTYYSIAKSDKSNNIFNREQSKKVNCGNESIEIIHPNSIYHQNNDPSNPKSPQKLNLIQTIQNSRVISNSNQTLNQLSSNSTNLSFHQSEHNQSIILFINDHLEIIQEIENDDEEIQQLKDCTILMEPEHMSNIKGQIQQHCLQIDFNGSVNEMVSSFNEGIGKIEDDNVHHKSQESLINVLLESHEKSMHHHQFNEPIAPIPYYSEKSNIPHTLNESRQLVQEPEESSIVKKLLKIKSLSSKHKKKLQSSKIDLDLSLKNVSMYDINEKTQISMEMQKVEMNSTSINFNTNSIGEDCQISEALSVLKQYNLTQNISQAPKNITPPFAKVIRPKQYFPKIKPTLQLSQNNINSLQNKQNVPCQALHSKSPQIKQSKHSSPHVIGLKHQSLRIISPRMVHNR